MDAEQAETIALSALAFLAGDIGRLGRFLALTGIGPGELKAEARTPEVLAAVLNHLLQDESLLLVFCAQDNIAPELIAPAHTCLETLAPDSALGGS
jgi:Protein of unknown function (DUF3572)